MPCPPRCVFGLGRGRSKTGARLLFGTFEVEGSDDAIFVRLLQDHLLAFVTKFGFGFSSLI